MDDLLRKAQAFGSILIQPRKKASRGPSRDSSSLLPQTRRFSADTNSGSSGGFLAFPEGKNIPIFQRVVRKFSCAFKGIALAVTTDNSFKTHIAFSLLVIAAGIFFQISSLEWALVLFAVGLVFVSELFNTAIEYLVRMFTQEYHKLAEQLLDISAGAVLFAAILAVILGLCIFLPKILVLFHVLP